MNSLILFIFLIAIRISTAAPISPFSDRFPTLKRVIKSVSVPPDTKTFLHKIPFFPVFVYGILVLCFAGAFWTFKKCRSPQPTITTTKRKRALQNNYIKLKPRRKKRELVSLINSNELEYDGDCELSLDKLQFGRRIGSGNFGKVNQGKLGNQLDVAIKRAHWSEDPDQRKMILDELKIMCAIGTHPCVIALVGGITLEGTEAMIVTEYADCGSLKDFLRGIRKNHKFTDLLNYTETPNQQKLEQYKKGVLSRDMAAISTIDLLSFAYQIATGMVYLASIPCVHRDLALRNVLLMSDGTIRIGDFGLTRRHENKEYYRIANPNIGIPAHWVAPECFTSEKFDEKSDVWSFGVSLFEMFTLGETPYKNIHDVSGYLKSGKRLAEPQYCHPKIYEFMKMCWATDRTFRPNFGMCAGFFKEHLMMIDMNSYQKMEDKLNLIFEQRCDMERQVRRLSE